MHEMIFAKLTQWGPLTVSLASHLLDIFFYSGLAGPLYLLEKNTKRILSVGSLHALVLCLTRFHQVLGWSSCLALSNQQGCVRTDYFTGRLRSIGTSFSTGSMVLLF